MLAPLGVAVAFDAVVVRAGAIVAVALLSALGTLSTGLLTLVAPRLEVRLALALLPQLTGETYATSTRHSFHLLSEVLSEMPPAKRKKPRKSLVLC